MVERNDHEAMASAALRLLEDPELALQLARRARESCRRFSWEVVQEEWLKLYHELARHGALKEGEVLPTA